MASEKPETWMRRAVRLSLRGFPAPNPRVGCVIVKNGEIVGEGWHDYAGGLHAEANALAQAGDRARGGEVFVTLEPCNHQGRQPACSLSLIQAGVRAVHYACPDTNPNVAGGGARALQAAGIVVNKGLLEPEARMANKVWLESMRLGRPFVTIKAAMTLDGRIALPSGESQWITSEASRKIAREMRAEMGAVLVGSATVLKDDPFLTVRNPKVKNSPIRIVLDPDRALDEGRQVFGPGAETWRVVRAENAKGEDIPAKVVENGIDLGDLLAKLWARNVSGLLVEGGSKTISSFLAAGLCDRLALFVGNVVFGSGPSWVEARLADSLNEATRWRLEHVKRVGNDVLMKFEP